MLIAGCGNTTDSKNETPDGSPAASTAAAKQDEVRTVKHAMGETQIKGTPQRVVILTNEGTEDLLTLGVKPVGAVKSWIGSPWYDHIKTDMEGVQDVGEETQPNLEMIAGLKPDLIIGNKVRHEKIYEQLKQIAPTVFAADLRGDWKKNFALYAEAVNKKAEGEKAMADFDQRVADVKAKLGDKTATKVSVVRFSSADVRIYQEQTFSGVLLKQLGIARPASQAKDQFMEQLTKERIPDMDGDVLFYFVSGTGNSGDASTKVAKEWTEDPLFKNLQVSKNNKAFQVNEVVWNLAGGYKAANLLLDEIAKYFEVAQ
ncbi:iron-siderophore ABC transporter substrate-binding protein [Paenibacillus hexagrammi]|uniref:Iron-siderophore ABC transporter substrate-binding protein n=2 Tax=Paenibacillus hexagrammi TaxID=2908839 RepID=A0ABY3SQE0_9BACL|nr:iron-siderophore ABC transporter substrate-binding protein [Paenibacillus sp. YPD9-1]UJF36228.1 iron-siderophore ABC transporter substrate-binding protein [Paenibacillus sp. YPD9-1]